MGLISYILCVCVCVCVCGGGGGGGGGGGRVGEGALLHPFLYNYITDSMCSNF